MFQLEILTFEKRCLSMKTQYVIIPAYNGLWGIEKGHAPSICVVKPGIVEVSDEKGMRFKYVIGEGICKITPLKTMLLVRSFERKEDIDKERLNRKLDNIIRKMRNLENYSSAEKKKIINAFLRNQARKKLAFS